LGRTQGRVQQLKTNHPHLFAPPFLVHRRKDNTTVVLAQTAVILDYLRDLHSTSVVRAASPLAVPPRDIVQLTLTVMDVVDTAHNIHHPVASSLYYEDQKTEALRAAETFWSSGRAEKLLNYFDELAKRHTGSFFFGDEVTHADCACYQAVEGLKYMFPNRMNSLNVDEKFRGVAKLVNGVRNHPELVEYFKSKRTAFTKNGIFRHYPELDVVSTK
jgi:glutathione S-transferase